MIVMSFGEFGCSGHQVFGVKKNWLEEKQAVLFLAEDSLFSMLKKTTDRILYLRAGRRLIFMLGSE